MLSLYHIAAATLCALLLALLSTLGLPVVVLWGVGAVLLLVAMVLVPGSTSGVQLEDVPHSDDLPIGFGRSLLNSIPVPLLVISGNGKIAYANIAALEFSDRINIGDHYTIAFRSAELIEAVNAVFTYDVPRRLDFTVSGTSLVYQADILSISDPMAFSDDARLIVKFEDKTQAVRDAQARADFVANASHELRTPLASILGYVETLQGNAKDDPTAQERFLGIIDRQASRMLRLVEDLMSLSRIESDETVLPTAEVDVAEAFAESASVLQPAARKAGVTLTVDPATARAMVRGDRDQLMQVGINLIDNAIKYAGAPGEVRVRYMEDDPDWIGISVEDNGAGIAREHLARLTERFYRINTAASRENGGTGLGLAIVKHIVNRHRGTMNITSEPGEGTRVLVRLPRIG